MTKVALAVKRDTRNLKLKIINSNTSAAYGLEDRDEDVQ